MARLWLFETQATARTPTTDHRWPFVPTDRGASVQMKANRQDPSDAGPVAALRLDITATTAATTRPPPLWSAANTPIKVSARQ
jgi:hypothetical protein